MVYSTTVGGGNGRPAGPVGPHAFGVERPPVELGDTLTGSLEGAGRMPRAGTGGGNTCGLNLTPHTNHTWIALFPASASQAEAGLWNCGF